GVIRCPVATTPGSSTSRAGSGVDARPACAAASRAAPRLIAVTARIVARRTLLDGLSTLIMLAMSRVRVLLAGVLAIFAAACGPLHRSDPSGPDRTIRVVTFNIHAGHGDLARTAETIRALSPDMVALQEVDVHWSERSGFVDQAAALAAALGMEARFAPIYSLPNRDNSAVPREFGVALLSRHHIVTWRNDTLTRLSTQDSNAVPGRAPGLLEALVDVDGSRVRVLNTHLDYRADPSVRRTQ